MNQKQEPFLSVPYVQGSYSNQVSIKNGPIGLVFEPFPNKPIFHNTLDYGDSIPRCKACGAFINKYDKLVSGTQYQCSICGTTNTGHRVSEDFDNFIYDAILIKRFPPSTPFQANTEFYFITLNALQQLPFFFSVLTQSFKTNISHKQVAIGIFHEAVSLFLFRPSLGVYTFSEIPEIPKLGKFFAHPDLILPSLEKIEKISRSLHPAHMMSISEAVSSASSLISHFSTQLHFFITGNEILSTEFPETLRENAMALTDLYCQVSIYVVGDPHQFVFENQSPIFDLPIVTGGRILSIPSNLNYPDLEKILLPIFRNSPYNSAIFWVCGPGGSELTDFAGNGYQLSLRLLSIPKISNGDYFVFEFQPDSLNSSCDCAQVVVVYSTELAVRKMRVVTINLKECLDLPNETAIARYGTAMIAHRLLLESKRQANDKLKYLKKQFHKPMQMLQNLNIFFESENLLSLQDNFSILLKSMAIRHGSDQSKINIIKKDVPPVEQSAIL